MASAVVSRKRTIQGKPKVKTGCTTCRIRRIKCDETKPFCERCVKTGRTCDGYSSPFRLSTTQSVNQTFVNTPSVAIAHPAGPMQNQIDPQDTEALKRYFSTKTVFGVKLDYDEEARQVLQASLDDPSIRHALSSLRALRDDFEASGDGRTAVSQQTSSYNYGLWQYSMALGGLASNLSRPDSSRLKSALLCCQIFISIEQVQGNFATMVQHIVRGLKIMREYPTRPTMDAANDIVPSKHNELPLVDVFVIKQFAAPCKFVDPTESLDEAVTTQTSSPASSEQYSPGTHAHRRIAPNTRTELTKIAETTLKFLEKVSQLRTGQDARHLLSGKASLLKSLRSWLSNLEQIQKSSSVSGSESISTSFMRLLYLTLKIVLLGTLDSLVAENAELDIENARMLSVAEAIDQKLIDCGWRNNTSDDQGQQSKIP